jgi:hypothetical protein
MKTGQVRITGPMTKEEKVKWDRMYARVEECDQAIEEYTKEMKLRRNKRYRQIIEDDIAHERRIRAIIVNGIGEPKRRDRS